MFDSTKSPVKHKRRLPEIDPADFDPLNGWGIYPNDDQLFIQQKYPHLLPLSEEELSHREKARREAAGLPPKVSPQAAERLAVLLVDYADIFAPIIKTLLGRAT